MKDGSVIREYYRAKELAKKYDVGLSSVWLYVKQGKLKAIKLHNRVTVFNIKEADEVLSKCSQKVIMSNLEKKNIGILAIEELQELQNKNCNNCKHLAEKEKNLNFECLIEVCRTCSRNNNDNWELKQ